MYHLPMLNKPDLYSCVHALVEDTVFAYFGSGGYHFGSCRHGICILWWWKIRYLYTLVMVDTTLVVTDKVFVYFGGVDTAFIYFGSSRYGICIGREGLRRRVGEMNNNNKTLFLRIVF